METSRLLLRLLELSDAARTQLLFPHWEIVRQLNASVPWPYPPDGALTYYRDIALPAIKNGTEWHWTIRLKDAPGEHIGAIALFRNDDDNRGFWLGKEWQGQGLMLEAVCAVTNYWFDTLGFPVLRTKKAANNAPSRRISEQTGMRCVDTIQHEFVEGRQAAEIWEITCAEWIEWQDKLGHGKKAAE